MIQADNPDRIYFAICYQSDNLEDYEELKKIKNCRIKYMKASEAKGSCFARNLCKQMIEDEKFVFQIDLEKHLNELGSEGWELVQIPADLVQGQAADGFALFKRKKEI